MLYSNQSLSFRIDKNLSAVLHWWLSGVNCFICQKWFLKKIFMTIATVGLSLMFLIG
jgi:hypothetical protein